MPVTIMATVLANFLGSLVIKNQLLSTRLHVFLGGMIAIVGVQLALRCTEWALFRYLFPISIGAGTGFVYSCLLYQAWKFFPAREGLISGIVIGGFGIGGYWFSTLSTQIINPENMQPMNCGIGETLNKPYTMEVASRLTLLIDSVCVRWAVIILLTMCLLREHEDRNGYSEDDLEKDTTVVSHRSAWSTTDYETSPSMETEFDDDLFINQSLISCINDDEIPLQTLLTSRKFITIYLLNSLTVTQGVFLVSSSKQLGQTLFQDDKFLSKVLGIASVAGAIRFIWSILLDSFAFKRVYSWLISIQISVGICLALISQINNQSQQQALWLTLVSLGFFCEGGHFVMAPTIYCKLFGPKDGIRVFGVGFSFIGLASIINLIIVTQFLSSVGF